MKIGELAEKTGLSRDTIRYYEKLGLFGDVARRNNNYRYYDARATAILGLIKQCKALGFTLKEINYYLEGILKEDLTFGDLQEAIKNKIAGVEENIRQLKKNLTGLKEVLEKCPRNQRIKECLE